MRCEGINGCNSNMSMSIMFIIEFDLIWFIPSVNSIHLHSAFALIWYHAIQPWSDMMIQFNLNQFNVMSHSQQKIIALNLNSRTSQTDEWNYVSMHASFHTGTHVHVHAPMYVHVYTYIGTSSWLQMQVLHKPKQWMPWIHSEFMHALIHWFQGTCRRKETDRWATVGELNWISTSFLPSFLHSFPCPSSLLPWIMHDCGYDWLWLLTLLIAARKAMVLLYVCIVKWGSR